MRQRALTAPLPHRRHHRVQENEPKPLMPQQAATLALYCLHEMCGGVQVFRAALMNG